MNSAVVEIRSYSGEVELHRHDFHQIILPCAGTLEIEIGPHAGRVAGAMASFVPAGQDHVFSAQPQGSFLVLDVPTVIWPEAMDEAAVPPFFAVGADLQGLIDYLTACAVPPSPPLLGAWSTLVLDRLAWQSGRPDRAELAVRRAIRFMQKRLADPIRVAEIAEAAGLSPSRLHDAFLKRRATTPHAQLSKLRLDAAQRFLADPRLSIAEIALRSGYADQSALTRAMRKARGTTPAKLRRSLLARTQG